MRTELFFLSLATASARHVDVRILEGASLSRLGQSARLSVVSSDPSFSSNESLTLTLERDETFFAQEYKELEIVDGKLTIRRSGVPSCYYVGTVEGGGRVRASTCGGKLSASISYAPQNDLVRHVEIGWDRQNREHSLRESSLTRRQSKSISSGRSRRRRRLDDGEAKTVADCSPNGGPALTQYVSLVLFNDASRYDRREEETEDQTALIASLTADIYAGGDESTFMPPGHQGLRGDGTIFNCDVRPVLVGQVTWRSGNPKELDYVNGTECERCGRPADVCESAEEFSSTCLLESFQEYVAGRRDEIESVLEVPFDSAHLLTGEDLDRSRAGLAYVETMCSDFSVGIESTLAYDGALQTAVLLAHEIGHTLGMNHDDQESEEHVMASSWGGRSASSYEFSNQSRSDVADFFATSQIDCVDSTEEENVAVGPVCGDGIVDVNEECDAGVGVVDECCRDDCTLACECSPLSPCCDETGHLAPAGTTCRSAEHAFCDFEEVCDGIVAECPVDSYATPGEECVSDVTGEDGKCYMGECVAIADNCYDYITRDDELAPNFCQQFSSCSILYCSPDGNLCYSKSNPMLAGSSCGNNKQCAPPSYEDTAAFDVEADSMTCVDSADLKTYRWVTIFSDSSGDPECDGTPTCVDETGAEVGSFRCLENPPERPGRCTDAPTASPAPTSSPKPSAFPTLSPTPSPSLTMRPTQTPTDARSEGNKKKSTKSPFSTFRNLSFALKIAVVVVIVAVFSCLCILCARPSLRNPVLDNAKNAAAVPPPAARVPRPPPGPPPRQLRREVSSESADVELSNVAAADPRDAQGSRRPIASTRRTPRRNAPAADQLHRPGARRPVPIAPTTTLAPPVYDAGQPVSVLQEEQDRELAAILAAEDEHDNSIYAPPQDGNYRVTSEAIDV